MRRVVILVPMVVVVAAACSDDAEDTTTTAAPATTTTEAPTTTAADSTTTIEATTTIPEPSPPEPPYLQAVDSEYGPILADEEGMALYLFTNDQQGGPSTCTGACAGTWPPLIGEVSAAESVDAGLIGSVERADGSLQVTYNGWPLYYYTPDTEPGHTRGQAVGGVWWLVSPDGEAVQ